ncbi:uncharacterized protein LOC143246842 isoform X2 [Tachypleus tridentatus]|uniref:uncharacterized protein LOC143246842 isoform X2 n=1 Tax=Tachypleus tridentatus TaxID=6853 RepID=UPI003FD558A7
MTLINHTIQSRGYLAANLDNNRKFLPNKQQDGGKFGTSSHNVSQPVAETFGSAIKPHSSDSGVKQKENGANVPSSKSLYGKINSASSSKETKHQLLPKDRSKYHKENKETKEFKFHSKEIPKRPQSPCQSSSGTKVTKKLKRSGSALSVTSKQKMHTKSDPLDKDCDKPSQISSSCSLKPKTEVKKKKNKEKSGQSDENCGGQTGEIHVKSSVLKPRKVREENSQVPTEVENFGKLPGNGNGSPASSISLCSLATGRIRGPFAAMIVEMEKDGKLLSPLSSSPGSPSGVPLKSEEMLYINDRESEEEFDIVKTIKDSLVLEHKKDNFPKLEGTPEHHSQCDPSYFFELEKLRQQIMSLRDRGHIQQVVDMIEETGLYFVTNSTFDFDLCSLDKNTVRKLQSCLTVK